MNPDWTHLAFQYPLNCRGRTYVPSPVGGSTAIAERVQAGENTILISGPCGVGKSVELEMTLHALRALGSFEPVHIRVDHSENIRNLTPGRLIGCIAICLAGWQLDAFDESPFSPETLKFVEILKKELADNVESPKFRNDPVCLLSILLHELEGQIGPRRPVLLIDGLDRLPMGGRSQDVLGILSSISDRVDLILAMPFHAKYGVQRDVVARHGEHWWGLRPPSVLGSAGHDGRSFLAQLLGLRLKLPLIWPEAHERPISEGLSVRRGGPPEAFMEVVAHAIATSGGIPGVFFQLLIRSATHCRQNNSGDWPRLDHFSRAAREMKENYARSMLPGDSEACRLADGTDGRELDLERKIRLLTRGLLVEQVGPIGPLLSLHPLVREAVFGPTQGFVNR